MRVLTTNTTSISGIVKLFLLLHQDKSVFDVVASVYQSPLDRAANNPTYAAEEIPLGHPLAFTLFLTLITTARHKPASVTSL